MWRGRNHEECRIESFRGKKKERETRDSAEITQDGPSEYRDNTALSPPPFLLSSTSSCMVTPLYGALSSSCCALDRVQNPFSSLRLSLLSFSHTLSSLSSLDPPSTLRLGAF